MYSLGQGLFGDIRSGDLPLANWELGARSARKPPCSVMSALGEEATLAGRLANTRFGPNLPVADLTSMPSKLLLVDSGGHDSCSSMLPPLSGHCGQPGNVFGPVERPNRRDQRSWIEPESRSAAAARSFNSRSASESGRLHGKYSNGRLSWSARSRR